MAGEDPAASRRTQPQPRMGRQDSAPLPERGAVDLDLWMGMEFEALDQQEVYGSHLSYQLIEGRFCGAAQFVLQSPAAPRGDHDFACSGLTVAPRILAWLIEIESVVCMLDG